MLTNEQLLLRKQGIGGSDAPAIVGLSPWATPLDIYLDKIDYTLKEREETEAQRRGSILEPLCKRLFERETGHTVETSREMKTSSSYPFMLANIDGFIPSEKSIVELKTAAYTKKSEWGEVGTDEIPKSYLIQVAHYAEVMEADKVYIACLFGDQKLFKVYQALYRAEIESGYPMPFDELEWDFRIYTYHRNQNLASKLIAQERGFWHENVLKKVPPSLQQGSATDILKAYPSAIPKKVELNREGVEKIRTLQYIKEQMKEIEALEENAKADVLSLFGKADTLVDD